MSKFETINLFDLDAMDAANAGVVSVYNPFEVPLDEKIEMGIQVIADVIAQPDIVCLVKTSFGKDSSIVNILALEALSRSGLKASACDNPKMIFMTCNTGMENPRMDEYVFTEVRKLIDFIKENDLPAEVHVAMPGLSNDYLVNVIGGRSIASFPDAGRKCTSMVKIEPMKRLERRLARRFGFAKGGSDNFVGLLGTRYEESEVRGRNMRARKESSERPANVATGLKPNGKPVDASWILSPIAFWTLDDVFFFAAIVRNGAFHRSYTTLEEMLQVYREANGGDCMVNIYAKGKPGKSPCGARTGCWSCTQVREDKSLKSMANEDDLKHLKPLNHLRSLLVAYHYDLSRRNFMPRSISDEGTVIVAPSAYSPDYCRDLLRWALTIDAEERERAASVGKPPYFEILSKRQVVGIDVLWQKYGYHSGLEACRTWWEVNVEGIRYPMPENIPQGMPTSLGNFKGMEYSVDMNQFYNFTEGFFDIAAAAADVDPDCIKPNMGDEYDVDEEGAELFFDFELGYALKRMSKNVVEPRAGLMYLVRLGTVTIYKGGLNEFDRAIRMGQFLNRIGLADVLNQPEKIRAVLQAHASKAGMPRKGSQWDLEDLLLHCEERDEDELEDVF
jgi:3'-phosphoadenosine 5'-phosphosulfate sulfotransferase (PAPS reductase)/FAD synthetase